MPFYRFPAVLNELVSQLTPILLGGRTVLRLGSLGKCDGHCAFRGKMWTIRPLTRLAVHPRAHLARFPVECADTLDAAGVRFE